MAKLLVFKTVSNDDRKVYEVGVDADEVAKVLCMDTQVDGELVSMVMLEFKGDLGPLIVQDPNKDALTRINAARS